VTRSVLFTPAAQAELIEAQDWYEREAPGLGATFRGEVDRVAEHLAANPLQFRTMLADVRRARLRRFPYGLSNMTQGSS
jgi:plasmid stabilization system protein ParE